MADQYQWGKPNLGFQSVAEILKKKPKAMTFEGYWNHLTNDGTNTAMVNALEGGGYTLEGARHTDAINAAGPLDQGEN